MPLQGVFRHAEPLRVQAHAEALPPHALQRQQVPVPVQADKACVRQGGRNAALSLSQVVSQVIAGVVLVLLLLY